jgi:hypothetical protein
VLEQWPQLRQIPAEPELPPTILTPIPELPLYQDGHWCRLVPDCAFVGRTMPSLKDHWSKTHQWSQFDRRGRPSETRTRATHAEITTCWQLVSCQRIFVRGPGSSYLRVEEPPAGSYPDPQRQTQSSTQIAIDLIQTTEQIYQASKRVGQSVIHAGAINEGNPWMQRTQWAVYLDGIPADHLLTLVETPEKDATGTEGLVRRLWDTVFSLLLICQRLTSVTAHSLRIEAARVESVKRPTQPLKAYMTEDRLKQHAEPWQRILAFFARTKETPSESNPPYKFSRAQQAKWDTL